MLDQVISSGADQIDADRVRDTLGLAERRGGRRVRRGALTGDGLAGLASSTPRRARPRRAAFSTRSWSRPRRFSRPGGRNGSRCCAADRDRAPAGRDRSGQPRAGWPPIPARAGRPRWRFPGSARPGPDSPAVGARSWPSVRSGRPSAPSAPPAPAPTSSRLSPNRRWQPSRPLRPSRRRRSSRGRRNLRATPNQRRGPKVIGVDPAQAGLPSEGAGVARRTDSAAATGSEALPRGFERGRRHPPPSSILRPPPTWTRCSRPGRSSSGR